MDFFIAPSSLVSNAKTQKVVQSLENKSNTTCVHLPRAQAHYRSRRRSFSKCLERAVKKKDDLFGSSATFVGRNRLPSAPSAGVGV